MADRRADDTPLAPRRTLSGPSHAAESNGETGKRPLSERVSSAVMMLNGIQVIGKCKELSPDIPVAVYCAYGFNVGCAVTDVLRQHGLDARFVRGGLSAWYAFGGGRAITPQAKS